MLLLEEAEPTHAACRTSLTRARDGVPTAEPSRAGDVDPVVQEAIAATGGLMYRPLIGQLESYPIPELRLPRASGQTFLELGCNWGRWCIAAARKGYEAIGIDPSLVAIRAARRVAGQLGVQVEYVVADARYLPFAGGSFDVAFSYSVLQHLAKEEVRTVLAEVARTLKTGGTCLVQMPNRFGLRNLSHQARAGFRQADGFDVRYWTPAELRSVFGSLVGPARLEVDGFFSLNAQASDLPLLRRRHRAVVRTSNALRALSERLPALAYAADSLYVRSIRR